MKSKISLLVIVLFVSLFSCHNPEKKPTIEIEKGMVGMIGYGPSISLQRTEQTLNRKYQDSIYLVHLEGFQREWNYVVSNSDSLLPAEYLKYDGFYIKGKDTIPFEKMIFLNITAQKESMINCVLYFITLEELIEFDQREIGYERIDVTNKIKEYNFKGGNIYAYKALLNYIYDPILDKNISIIHKSYLDLVTNACDSIGTYYRKEYEATTKPFNTDLVAPVIWKKVR